jgi:hypothetical protein
MGQLLLAIVAQFVDEEDGLIRALLGLREVAGHLGEEQFKVLLPVLKDYGIVRQIGAVISDNSGTNDTLCREIEAHLLQEERIEWDAEHWRIRCTGHIINLAVQAFLFYNALKPEELESYDDMVVVGGLQALLSEDKKAKFRLLGPLGQLHNIIIHFGASPQREAEFKVLAGRGVPLDNRTRWNCWNLMLCIALNDTIAAAIDTYTKSHLDDLFEDYLSPQDWEQLRTIATFLKPFYRATLKT